MFQINDAAIERHRPHVPRAGRIEIDRIPIDEQGPRCRFSFKLFRLHPYEHFIFCDRLTLALP